MDKEQAIHEFWSSFGLLAYDEGTVPDEAQLPYITYTISTDSIGNPLQLNASLWYDSTSWKEITKKTEEISRFITNNGYYLKEIDGGYLWIQKGVPFAQRMSDPESDTIRRMYLNITVEFLTAY